MPHMGFNWVDVFFVILLTRICYIGFKNGFVPEIFRALGIVLAFIFSFNNYTLLSRFLSIPLKGMGAELDAVSFVFIFLAIVFIFKAFSVVACLFLGGPDISWPNRMAGLLVGFGRGILLASLIYTLFVNSPFEYLTKSARDRAFLSCYISGVAPYVYERGINLYPWKKVETPLVDMLER